MCVCIFVCVFVTVSRDNVLALVRLVFTTLSDAMEDNPANRRHFDNNVRHDWWHVMCSDVSNYHDILDIP